MPMPNYFIILRTQTTLDKNYSKNFYLSSLKLIFSKKEKLSFNNKRFTTMQTKDQRHPSFNIKFESFMFKVSEPKQGNIAIEFEDVIHQTKYTINKSLQQVSYKTVVTALRQSEPDIVSATLTPLASKQYQLRVKVKLQYLNEIQEVFFFEGIKMDEKRVSELKKVTRIQAQLKNVREEILNAAKQYYISSNKIANKPRKTQEILLDIHFNQSIFSINLSFKNLSSNIIKTSFTYCNPATRAAIGENMLPDQMFVLNPIDIVVIAHNRHQQKAILKIEGEFDQFEYTIKCQSGVSLQPKNIKKIVVGVIKVAAIGLSAWAISLVGKALFHSGPEL